MLGPKGPSRPPCPSPAGTAPLFRAGHAEPGRGFGPDCPDSGQAEVQHTSNARRLGRTEQLGFPFLMLFLPVKYNAYTDVLKPALSLVQLPSSVCSVSDSRTFKMTVDSGGSTELPAEKTRDEERSLALTTPNDSQPETDVADGTGMPTNDAEPPAPEAKRSVTGLKVRGIHSASWAWLTSAFLIQWFFAYGAILSTVFLFALDGTIVR